MGADSTLVPIELLENGFDDTLNGRFAHRAFGRGRLRVILAFGGKDPLFIAMSLVVLSEDLKRCLWQRDHSILGSLSTMNVDQHAIGVDIGDLEMESFLEPKSQGIDDEEEARHGRLFDQLEKCVDFTDRDDDWDLEFSACSHELERVPVSRAGERKKLLQGLLSDLDGTGRPVSLILDEE